MYLRAHTILQQFPNLVSDDILPFSGTLSREKTFEGFLRGSLES